MVGAASSCGVVRCRPLRFVSPWARSGQSKMSGHMSVTKGPRTFRPDTCPDIKGSGHFCMKICPDIKRYRTCVRTACPGHFGFFGQFTWRKHMHTSIGRVRTQMSGQCPDIKNKMREIRPGMSVSWTYFFK
jgi:hypothetical protein